MKTVLTQIAPEGPRPLNTVRFGSDVVIDWLMKLVQDKGDPCLRRDGLRSPIRVFLTQNFGTDLTLLDLYERRTGFDLKATFIVEFDDNGTINERELVDITFHELLADHLGWPTVSNSIGVWFVTHTPPTFRRLG
jgi:hypothetical protein